MGKLILKRFCDVFLLFILYLVVIRLPGFNELIGNYPAATAQSIAHIFPNTRSGFLLTASISLVVTGLLIYRLRKPWGRYYWDLFMGALYALVLMLFVRICIAGFMSYFFFHEPAQVFGDGDARPNLLLLIPSFAYPVAYFIVLWLLAKTWAKVMPLVFLFAFSILGVVYALNPDAIDKFDEWGAEVSKSVASAISDSVPAGEGDAPLSDEERFTHLKAYAEKGDPRAYYELFKCYFNGVGTARDYDQAAVWAKKAWENRNPMGAVGLGDLYRTRAWASYDPDKAIKYYSEVRNFWGEEAQAGAKAGLTIVYGEKAERYLLHPDESESKEAIECYKMAAHYGHVEAAYRLGMYYVDQEYYETAGKYFGIVVDNATPETFKNYAEAEYYLALYYDHYGWAARKEAPKFYERAAEHGHLKAQELLAKRYRKGDDLFSKDPERAALWEQRAAETRAKQAK